MKKAFEEVVNLAKLENKNIAEKTCKLSEEALELIQAINKSIGMKRTDQTKEEILDEIKEEVSDVIQNAFCIANHYNISYDEIISTIYRKNKKWKKRIDLK